MSYQDYKIIGVNEMNFNLKDVKDGIRENAKAGGTVGETSFTIADFGDGYDVYCNITLINPEGVEEKNSLQMAEEVTKGKAEAQAKRQAQSLTKFGYPTEYIGNENEIWEAKKNVQ